MRLSLLAVPRWVNFKLTETKKLELHVFADGKAYGVAGYINVTNTNSKHCNLVLGKSKIVPSSIVSFKNKTNRDTRNGHTHRQYLFMV